MVSAASHRVGPDETVYIRLYDAYTTPPRWPQFTIPRVLSEAGGPLRNGGCPHCHLPQVSVDLVKGRVRVGVTDGVRVGVGIRVRVRVRGGVRDGVRVGVWVGVWARARARARVRVRVRVRGWVWVGVGAQ